MATADSLVIPGVTEHVFQGGPDVVLDAAFDGDLEDSDSPIRLGFDAELETIEVYEGEIYVFERSAEGGFVLGVADVKSYPGKGG
jgi:hypothetical protein